MDWDHAHARSCRAHLILRALVRLQEASGKKQCSVFAGHSERNEAIALACCLIEKKGFATPSQLCCVTSATRYVPTSDTVQISSLMSRPLRAALLRKPGEIGGYAFSGVFLRRITIQPVQRLSLEMGFNGTFANLKTCSTLRTVSLFRGEDDPFCLNVVNNLPDCITTLTLHGYGSVIPRPWPTSLTDLTLGGSSAPCCSRIILPTLASTKLQKLQINCRDRVVYISSLPETLKSLKVTCNIAVSFTGAGPAMSRSALQHLDLQDVTLGCMSPLPTFPQLKSLRLSAVFDGFITREDYPLLTYISVYEDYEHIDSLQFCDEVCVRND